MPDVQWEAHNGWLVSLVGELCHVFVVSYQVGLYEEEHLPYVLVAPFHATF